MDTKNNTTPVIAIVGRTNVGKSTLFNRLLEKKHAITSSKEGTTQDIKFGLCHWQGSTLTVIDTAGLDLTSDRATKESLKRQAVAAMRKADLILFLVDAETGLMPQDIAMSRFLQKSVKPVILAVNKADSPAKRNRTASEKWVKLGLGEPMAISAANGSGVGDLLEHAIKELESAGVKSEPLPPIDLRVAIIGRPNVGKSSLLNALAGEERVIVSEIPHTTKEPQDTLITLDHPELGRKNILVVDTVGIRKKGKVERGLESLGVHLSIGELERADVALLVVDAKEGIGAQEKKLTSLIENKNVGVIIVANKWDLVGDETSGPAKEFRAYVQKQLPSFTWAPVIFISALTGRNVPKVLDMSLNVDVERQRTVPQEELDAFFDRLKKQHGRMVQKGPNKPGIYGMSQTDTAPPRFMVVMQKKGSMPESFLRFIANRLREEFGFEGVPIKVSAREIRK